MQQFFDMVLESEITTWQGWFFYLMLIALYSICVFAGIYLRMRNVSPNKAKATVILAMLVVTIGMYPFLGFASFMFFVCFLFLLVVLTTNGD
jgi:cyanate permease